ncbi:glycosyltransferase [uncultured Fusobacterium sp.]|uniref:glycosyltransferase n=1 Tax=uncultured Fusobacterium sp. TaxID=159267 RepID=UPI0015A5F80C|nr:glycosyltransferase [uncultured Fusobacterium sp.]
MKKKVLFYNGSLRMGGIERVLVEVLQNLDRNNLDIDLVIEDGIRSLNIFERDIPKDIKLYYLKPEEVIKKTDFYRQNRKNIFHKIIYNLMMAYEGYIKKENLKKIVKDKNYDVVIDFDMGLSKQIDLVEAKKKIAWIHANIKSWYVREDRIKRLGERLQKYTKIVAICEAMKESTIELFPFLKDKIVRIYNPFNFERVIKKSEESIDENLKEYYDKDFIVSIMRLTEHQKDFDTLILGLKLTKEKGVKEKLYILGDGPDREKIEEKIKKEGMEKDIILLGNIKNPYPWIKKAKMLVHSSKYEGLPTVLIEALILDKIVISSDCPTGPREILENGEIGYLYNIGDYRKLGELIVENLKNSEIDLDLIRERILKYSKDVVIKEYEKIILG